MKPRLPFGADVHVRAVQHEGTPALHGVTQLLKGLGRRESQVVRGVTRLPPDRPDR
jgi:hypothetical protein